MSKFHKTLKNHFTVGEEYLISLRSSAFYKAKYERLLQGHLIFNNGTSISGGMIRDNQVVIKSLDGKTFTVNGWIKE